MDPPAWCSSGIGCKLLPHLHLSLVLCDHARQWGSGMVSFKKKAVATEGHLLRCIADNVLFTLD